MLWKPYINGFKNYMRLERALCANTMESYIRVVQILTNWLSLNESSEPPAGLRHEDFQSYIAYMNSLGFKLRAQSRLISGMKSF